MTETWKQYMERMQDTYGHLPNHISNIAAQAERNKEMNAVNLPIGEGQFTVWGIPATERDDNRGLASSQQDATTNEIEVYRTNDESEARRMVRESGFEYQGVFYATTRMSNANAAVQKERVQQASGILKRDTPNQSLNKDQF